MGCFGKKKKQASEPVRVTPVQVERTPSSHYDALPPAAAQAMAASSGRKSSKDDVTTKSRRHEYGLANRAPSDRQSSRRRRIASPRSDRSSQRQKSNDLADIQAPGAYQALPQPDRMDPTVGSTYGSIPPPAAGGPSDTYMLAPQPSNMQYAEAPEPRSQYGPGPPTMRPGQYGAAPPTMRPQSQYGAGPPSLGRSQQEKPEQQQYAASPGAAGSSQYAAGPTGRNAQYAAGPVPPASRAGAPPHPGMRRRKSSQMLNARGPRRRQSTRSGARAGPSPRKNAPSPRNPEAAPPVAVPLYEDWRLADAKQPPPPPGPPPGDKEEYVDVHGSAELYAIIRGQTKGAAPPPSKGSNLIKKLKADEYGKLWRPTFDRATAEQALKGMPPGYGLARPTTAKAPSRASGGSDCICLSYRTEDDPERIMHTIIFLANKGRAFALENDENEVETFASVDELMEFLEIKKCE